MSKNSKLSGFLINLLGVILGITLTFGVNALWQKKEEKKKIREMLILVRNELETNKKWYKKQEQILRQDSYYFRKLLEADKKWSSIPNDSLEKYTQFANIKLLQFSNSAWQIFQNSEEIKKISDKELVIKLTDCYYEINTFYEFIMKNYWDKKLEAIAIPLFENELFPFLDALINMKESFYFLQLLGDDSDIWNIFPQVEAVIDYNISLLDKYGDFKYDIKEKDEEFISFVNARVDSVKQNRMKHNEQ